MQCPACGRNLTPVQAGSITIDVCKDGCGGMWFDQLELKRLDEPHESEGQTLLDIAVDPQVSVRTDMKHQCPKCEDVTMMRFFYSPQQKVSVDHCGSCGGHWLDLGELRQVRSLYPSEAERIAHIEQIIDEEWGDEIADAEKRAQIAAARRPLMRKMFGFFIPGI